MTARSATFFYRANKFFQRNKISVIAAFVVFLSLISGIAVALSQARKANAPANLAIEAQKKSDDEKEKAEKISRFMFKVFSYANPLWYAEGYKTRGQARVFDALDDLSGKIETEFPDQADVQAELYHRFSEVYSGVFGKRSASETALHDQRRNADDITRLDRKSFGGKEMRRKKLNADLKIILMMLARILT